MDFSVVILAVLALCYVGVVIYAANQNELRRTRGQLASDSRSGDAGLTPDPLRWLLYGLAVVSFVSSLLILQMTVLGSAPADLPAGAELQAVDMPGALSNFVLGVVIAWLCYRLVASGAARERLRRWLRGRGSYDPASSVHTSAAVLALTLLSVTVGQLVLSGGLSGLAQSVEQDGVSSGALVFQGVLMVTAAFLGVGLLIRRTPAQALERLGLRWPTTQDIGWGVGGGVALYFALIMMAMLWALLVPADQLQQQSAAAEQIARAFDTLPLALLLSITAALSEEILFRGALQPVFGLGLTSVLFALVHMQYALTPAAIIIFVVALGLGWLRQRQSTTAAVIAHFIYNFVQLAAAMLVARAAG